MRDNRRRYRTIKQALKKLYPTEPRGNQARHLTTLAALISGIVGSRSCQLPAIASKVPEGTRKESRVKRYTRWLQNERSTTGCTSCPMRKSWLPYWRAKCSCYSPSMGAQWGAAVWP